MRTAKLDFFEQLRTTVWRPARGAHFVYQNDKFIPPSRAMVSPLRDGLKTVWRHAESLSITGQYDPDYR